MKSVDHELGAVRSQADVAGHPSGKGSVFGWTPASFSNLSPKQIQRLFTFGLVGLFVFRLLALLLPLDLSGDEAYYWDWGRNLDWGYYSKPPGIGWLMAVAGWVGGNSAFGVRLFAVLFGTGSLWLVFCLANRMYGPVVALLAALVFVANPANAALNFIFTIDSPLVFCWLAAAYAFWRCREAGFRSPLWAAILTVALMAGLLSKQMMLVFYPLALASLITDPQSRPLLKRPLLWLCFALSLLALVPPVAWNARHHWITARHTMHHFEAPSWSLKSIGRVFEFLGAQLGLLTPVLAVLLAAALIGAVLSWNRIGARERYLVWLSAPGLLVVLLMSFRQRINANWPAVYYPTASVLVAAWAADAWRSGRGLDRWRRAFPFGVNLGVTLAVATYAAMAAFALGWLPTVKIDPSARLRGWSKLAGDVAEVQRSVSFRSNPIVVVDGHRFLASELAFYLPDQPRVYLFNPQPDDVQSQYDLWPQPPRDKEALIVVEGSAKSIAPELAKAFAPVELVKELDYPDRRSGRKFFTVFVRRQLLESHEP